MHNMEGIRSDEAIFGTLWRAEHDLISAPGHGQRAPPKPLQGSQT